ncbi:MAG: exo-alpha-sialidase, partial [Planctomycetota bacterium]
PKGGRLRVFRSRNGGDAWEPLDRGLPAAPTYVGVLRGAMVTDALDPCGIYVGDTSGRVHVSADAGDSWQTLPFTLPRILNVRTYLED